jgi:CubicO group peptidase (beta-lactamase class C family)
MSPGRLTPGLARYAGPVTAMDEALSAIETWGAGHAAAAVLAPSGILASRGDDERVFRWASVTKIATALVVLVLTDDGVVELDEPAGPPGSTVRHLLAHASGLPFEGLTAIAPPGTRRIYSNGGFDTLGTLVTERVGEPFEVLLRRFVLGPLGMDATTLRERPSQGLHGPLRDFTALGRELLAPTLLRPETYRLATSVAFPGLIGQLPGVGRFDPLDWGLGFELRDGKIPHWTGSHNSPETFGHFGGAGTFIWVDPVRQLATAVLTDREYDAWALEVWPTFSDAVLAAVGDQPAA